jgi:ion channel-forming bestrophin family protein
VALPPADDTTGKTPSTDVTPLQLRRRKTDTLKLVLSFVYAVKHYLREEDGLDWDDYDGIIPTSFIQAQSRRSSRTGSISTTYNAVSDHSRSTSPSRSANVNSITTLTATKRVRVKRSLDKIQTAKTPLVAGEHSSICFSPRGEASMPFPLV